jgi:hypothetical protein
VVFVVEQDEGSGDDVAEAPVGFQTLHCGFDLR